jgi:hypothetical protein|eukprot:COSAG01_NODE_2921_length_6846_cov_4.205276_3_plen_305_part_00
MKRTGEDDANIPVLPEYMVSKVSLGSQRAKGNWEVVRTLRAAPPEYIGWQAKSSAKLPEHLAGKPTQKHRSGTELWSYLRPRLGMLVRLQKHWGTISQLYDSKRETLFEHKNIPAGMRDPDSAFSCGWDIIQVFALLYVTAVVPIRVGFSEEPKPGANFAFMLDVVVDLYFIIDLFLSFRTAVWLNSGALEVDRNEITRIYLKSWFTVDLLSCLPVTYVALIISCSRGDCNATGGETKGIKMLRLLRLAKLLRLSKLQRLFKKYQDSTFDITVTPAPDLLNHCSTFPSVCLYLCAIHHDISWRC